MNLLLARVNYPQRGIVGGNWGVQKVGTKTAQQIHDHHYHKLPEMNDTPSHPRLALSLSSAFPTQGQHVGECKEQRDYTTFILPTLTLQLHVF